jgi:hypothetical protein
MNSSPMDTGPENSDITMDEAEEPAIAYFLLAIF